MKMCWLSFKETGSYRKERGRRARGDSGELEKSSQALSLFIMNVYLPKGIETNVTNNRGPTLIIFYFPIMTRAEVGKLFPNRPESNCFRACGPRGKIQAIICFYITIKNIKTILSSSIGKKQEAGWVWPMILGLLTLDHHVFFWKKHNIVNTAEALLPPISFKLPALLN